MMKTHEIVNGRSYPIGVAGTLAKIDQWGRDRNIIGDGTSKDQMLKLGSEFGELCDAVAKRDTVGIMDGIGDMIVVLCMVAGIEGAKIDDCIEHAYNEIKDRKGVLFGGVFIKSTDPRYSDVLDQLADQRRSRDAQAADRAKGPLDLNQIFNDGMTLHDHLSTDPAHAPMQDSTSDRDNDRRPSEPPCDSGRMGI